MNNKTFVNKNVFRLIMIVIIMLQMVAAFYFCTQKQGCHYDEYYSYYSSNVTSGLVPTDNEWMDTQEIRNEFMVTDGMGFKYGMVRLMQTYDVHPPFYYFILHTICSLSPNIFSLWQGLSINLFFFLTSLLMLWRICDIVSDDNQYISLFTLALYGFSPAIISGVTFIRMYMLLTFLCMVGLYIHLKALKAGTYNFKSLYLPVIITTFLGFMTHYYFLVFMFFMAAYMSLFLFHKKETRRSAYLYATSVIVGMLLAVISYPACLKHIFRGYRGTEAIGAFMDASNLSERAGLFVGLLQEYLLCNTFYILLLIVLLLGITYYYMVRNRKAKKVVTEEMSTDNDLASAKWMIGLIGTIAAGYFLVVMKTALTNAEEAIRYEMPIYALLILLLVYAMYFFSWALIKNKGLVNVIVSLLLIIATVLEIGGLANDKVLFLYKSDANDYAWAMEHKEDSIAYIYNYENQWMIWDDSTELMKYDKIFFVNMNNTDKIVDNDVINADKLYVFSVRSDSATEKLNEIIDSNKNVDTATIVRELKYVDVYELN